MERLCPSGHAGDRGPGLEGLGSGGSILAGGAVIAAEVEHVVDLIVSGEEALSLAGRLEALHLVCCGPTTKRAPSRKAGLSSLCRARRESHFASGSDSPQTAQKRGAPTGPSSA